MSTVTVGSAASPHSSRPLNRTEWLYSVRFSGRELWGEAADPTLTVSIDAWESYLDA